MKILLVEDTRSLSALIKARLTLFGYEVCIAENGEMALERFRELAPDLVLMDIEMPVMNGFEACNRIRALEATQQWAWTPIIFLTASATEENLITAIEAGGDDFMSKTVPEAVLQAKMKAMTRIAALRRSLSAANRQLEDLASRDGLTGLCNRRYMDLNADMLWDTAVRMKKPFALLMLDIDNFKKYNDCYGHLAGDDCLRAVAQAVAAAVGQADGDGRASGAFVARYGGEEFAIVMPGATPAAYREMAAAVLDAVRRLAIAHEHNAAWGIVTVSIGGTHREVADQEISQLFRAADAQLYLAKQHGRNCAELH